MEEFLSPSTNSIESDNLMTEQTSIGMLLQQSGGPDGTLVNNLQLMLVYIWQVMSPIFSIYIVALLDSDGYVDIGWDILLFAVQLYAGYIALFPVLFLQIVNLVFGWFDGLLVFLITHWVSNATFAITVYQLFLNWLFLADGERRSEGFRSMTIWYAVQAFFFINATQKLSPKVNAYIKPDWEHFMGEERLLPSVFYLFFWIFGA